MVFFKTVKRWKLGPGQYLDILRNDTDRVVIFAIGQEDEGSRVQERIRFKLSMTEALEVARFIANITSLKSLETLEDEEDTDPHGFKGK